jgi:hypothetical protein
LRRVVLPIQLAVIALAAAAALAPLPPDSVERLYADRFYPALQSSLTSWSNQTAFALFDVVVVIGGLLLAAAWWRWIRGALRQRTVRPILKGLLNTLTVGGALYLWFALAWGLNYRRNPLEQAIGYDESRVTPEAVLALAERAVTETNRSYGPAHNGGFPQVSDMPPTLVRALHDVEQRLGRPRPTTPGRPKRTLLATFFRAAGVDGMSAPFLLETLLNPDLTGPERPAVLAHEWAHLAGYAPEDDASFVGLVTALRGDAAAQYSAWLAIAFDAAGQLSGSERQRVLSKLEPGPRKDQDAIVARLRSRVEVVQRASWETYDRYLKSHGVREGIRSYGRVIQLLVGSNALSW